MHKATLWPKLAKTKKVARTDFLDLVHVFVATHASNYFEYLVHFLFISSSRRIKHEILVEKLRKMIKPTSLSTFMTETTFQVWTKFNFLLRLDTVEYKMLRTHHWMSMMPMNIWHMMTTAMRSVVFQRSLMPMVTMTSMIATVVSTGVISLETRCIGHLRCQLGLVYLLHLLLDLLLLNIGI